MIFNQSESKYFHSLLLGLWPDDLRVNKRFVEIQDKELFLLRVF